jgi:hypothetical protein
VERIRNAFDRRVTVALALVAVLTAACQGQPVPLAAARGTTVMIPVGSGGFNFGEGVLMGYGTEGDLDYQRGRLRLWLDIEPGSDVQLNVRGIARVSPDAASRAGLSLGADWEWPGQVVVMADVPTNAPVGVWPVYATRHLYQWNSGTSMWDEQATSVAAPAYQYQLEILSEVRSPTPFEGFAVSNPHDVSDEVLDFKPLPKFRFHFNNTTLGAVNFTVTYPSSRAVIRAVLAEPLGDSEDWASSALISYSETTPGTLVVSCVAPTGVFAAAFSVVFELTHPTDPPPTGGPLSTSDFVISGIQGWNVSGAPVTATVGAGTKKIF